MANWIDKFRELMGRTSHNTPTSIAVPLDDQSVARLMHLLCETRDDELSCEEVFSRLDEYVDCLISRTDVGSDTHLLEHHLGICPDCRDELVALVHALESATTDDNLIA